MRNNTIAIFPSTYTEDGQVLTFGLHQVSDEMPGVTLKAECEADIDWNSNDGLWELYPGEKKRFRVLSLTLQYGHPDIHGNPVKAEIGPTEGMKDNFERAFDSWLSEVKTQKEITDLSAAELDTAKVPA